MPQYKRFPSKRLLNNTNPTHLGPTYIVGTLHRILPAKEQTNTLGYNLIENIFVFLWWGWDGTFGCRKISADVYLNRGVSAYQTRLHVCKDIQECHKDNASLKQCTRKTSQQKFFCLFFFFVFLKLNNLIAIQKRRRSFPLILPCMSSSRYGSCCWFLRSIYSGVLQADCALCERMYVAYYFEYVCMVYLREQIRWLWREMWFKSHAIKKQNDSLEVDLFAMITI